MSLLTALEDPAPGWSTRRATGCSGRRVARTGALRAVPRAAGVHLVALDGAGGTGPGGSAGLRW